jgi:predicted nicotinamide N-methyase
LENEEIFPKNHFISKNLIELGAGTGLVSITAAALGANVIATDMKEILPLLMYNIQQNEKKFRSKLNIHIKELTWYERKNYRKFPIYATFVIYFLINDDNDRGNETQLQQFDGMHFDYILCSDVVYDPNLFQSLILTMNRLSTKNTKIYMSYKYRYPCENQFFEHLLIQFDLCEVSLFCNDDDFKSVEKLLPREVSTRRLAQNSLRTTLNQTGRLYN